MPYSDDGLFFVDHFYNNIEIFIENYAEDVLGKYTS